MFSIIGCSKSSNNYWKSGIDKQSKGLNAEAVSDYKKAIGVDLKKISPIALSVMTTSRDFSSEDLKEILAEDIMKLIEGIKNTDRNVDLFIALGFIFSTLQQYYMGILEFTKAIAFDPQNSTAFLYRGLAYWQAGNISNEMKVITGKRSKAIIEQLGNFGNAMTDLDKAIELNPNNAEAYYYRGIVYQTLGDTDKATRDVNKALQIGGILIKDKAIYTLKEIQGEQIEETPDFRLYFNPFELASFGVQKRQLVSTYVHSFISNKEPLNRPFGYTWGLLHYKVRRD